MHHTCQAWALPRELPLLSSRALEPELHNERSRGDEKPPPRN